jgi:hypothetical protein
MAITRIEYPINSSQYPATFEFDLGSSIEIDVLTDIPDMPVAAEFQANSGFSGIPSTSAQATTNILGHAYIYLGLPNQACQGKVNVKALNSFIGDAQLPITFNIGVGMLPAPGPPIDQSGGSGWDTLIKVLPWVALIAAVGYAVNAVRKK